MGTVGKLKNGTDLDRSTCFGTKHTHADKFQSGFVMMIMMGGVGNPPEITADGSRKKRKHRHTRTGRAWSIISTTSKQPVSAGSIAHEMDKQRALLDYRSALRAGVSTFVKKNLESFRYRLGQQQKGNYEAA